MEKIRLKTNLKCSLCVEKIAKVLDSNNQVRSWSVDLDSPDRVLEAETSLRREELIEIIEKEGYRVVEDNK